MRLRDRLAHRPGGSACRRCGGTGVEPACDRRADDRDRRPVAVMVAEAEAKVARHREARAAREGE